ncbi:MAG: BlaI/MecI/CopY family transcriptional regulator [Sphingomonadales bacterium]
MSAKVQRPTEGEMEILSVLWEQKAASVKEVYQKLSSYKQTGYTTTLKLLQLMFDKGMVTRSEQGRKHIYRPSIDLSLLREQQTSRLIGHLFEGSPVQLALHVLRSSYYRSTPDEIAELKKLVEAL